MFSLLFTERRYPITLTLAKKTDFLHWPYRVLEMFFNALLEHLSCLLEHGARKQYNFCKLNRPDLREAGDSKRPKFEI